MENKHTNRQLHRVVRDTKSYKHLTKGPRKFAAARARRRANKFFCAESKNAEVEK